jgi:hypothetical protein
MYFKPGQGIWNYPGSHPWDVLLKKLTSLDKAPLAAEPQYVTEGIDAVEEPLASKSSIVFNLLQFTNQSIDSGFYGSHDASTKKTLIRSHRVDGR